MNSEWKTATKYVIGVFLAIFIVFLVYISRSVIYILFSAALISLLLRPLILFLLKRLRFPRIIAVLVAHLLAAIIILVTPMILVPPVLDAAAVLLEIDYQELINDVLLWTETSLVTLKQSGLSLLGFNLYFDSVIDPILGYLQGVSPAFQLTMPSYDVIIDNLVSAFTVSYGIALSLLGSVVSGLVAFLFLILSSIYISMDGPVFYRGFLKWFPDSQRFEIATLNKRIRNTWDSFFRGQFWLMVIIGTSVWLGLTILGVPGAFALGILAGLLEIIPSIGPILAAIPAIIVALIQGSNHFDINHLIFALIVIGFYILLQLFENYVVVPQVLGGAVKLHPLVVMAGVLIGASIWGILGALLAAPIIASIKEIFEFVHRKLLGKDPFPDEEEKVIAPIPWRESFRAIILKGQQFAQDKLPVSNPSVKTGEDKEKPEIDIDE